MRNLLASESLTKIITPESHDNINNNNNSQLFRIPNLYREVIKSNSSAVLGSVWGKSFDSIPGRDLVQGCKRDANSLSLCV